MGVTVHPHRRVIERVRELAGDVSAHLPPEAGAAVDDALVDLDGPLRLAVVGRVSSGKSTLVNALVGRRVAPTSAGECTRVVTWYRWGAPDSLTIHMRDGTTRPPVGLDDGRVPQRLDVPVDQVDHLEVRLASRPLRNLTLIDTPGLESGSETGDTATRRAILGEDERSRLAASQADGLLYLIGDAARRSEVDFLADFRASSGNLSTHALNAVGVLAQADRLSSGPFDPRDPFDTAAEVADALERDHPGTWSHVVPVSGLLSETARTGQISDDLAARLADLAPLDPVSLSLRARDGDLGRIFRVFGPYGVISGREVAAEGAVRLAQWCDERSGVVRLEEVVGATLVPRAPLLKAIRVVAMVEASAQTLTGQAREEALTLVETAELDPALHPLTEVRALQLVSGTASGQTLRDQLAAVLGQPDPATLLGAQPTSTPAELVELAKQRSAAATSMAALALRPAEAAAGRVLARSYQLLARRLAASEAT